MPILIQVTLATLGYLILRGIWSISQYIQSVPWSDGGDLVIVEAVTVSGKSVPVLVGLLLAWGIWQRRFGYARALRVLMLLGIAATLAGFIVGMVKTSFVPGPSVFLFIALQMLPMGVIALCLYHNSLQGYWRP